MASGRRRQGLCGHAYGWRSCAIVGSDRSAPAMPENDTKSIQKRLMELQLQHRDLDDVVVRLSQDPMVDQLQLTRLKKRKLQLKDQIARLKSQLIPDLDA